MIEEAVHTADSEEERCIFLGNDGVCEKLNHKDCPAGGCSFRVLPGDEARKREVWCKRLSALDEAQQKEISKKYYGGGRPWRVK